MGTCNADSNRAAELQVPPIKQMPEEQASIHIFPSSTGKVERDRENRGPAEASTEIAGMVDSRPADIYPGHGSVQYQVG